MKKIIAALLISFQLAVAEPGDTDFLRQVRDLPLPGKPTRFDYQSFDPKAERLYLSHMGDGELVVFDTKAEKILTNLPGFPVMTGVLVIPSLKKVYGSVTQNHEMAVVDTALLKIIKRIPAGKFPDGLAYAPLSHKLFVSDEAGEVEVVIDALTDKKIGTIALGGEAGNTQYDPTSQLIYVCVQTLNEFVAINPQTEKIVARYKIKGGRHPHGFYIDDQHNKAYIACQDDGKLVVFNLKTHFEEEVFSVGGDPDVLAYDRTLNVLYVACESGVVSIFKYDGKLTKIGDQTVGPNCHSVSVDSSSHKVYFPLKNVNGSPVLRIMVPKKI